MRKRGNAKEIRDRWIREFARKHPLYTHREIGERCNLDHSTISEILKKEVKDASPENIRPGA